MNYEAAHPSDQQLLLELEGELPPNAAKQVRAHINSCWTCRARCQELESAIVDFIRAHHEEIDSKMPPAAGPRALLKARIAQLSGAESRPRRFALPRRSRWALAIAACTLLAAALFLDRSHAGRDSLSRPRPHAMIVSIPDSRLTPGATVLTNRLTVCAQPNVKNKSVPVALRSKVFEEYGIAGAEPRAYEVDYLVTPALGGADDIHNLWPHSYSATVWNSRVKDALEDHLRDMVCDGNLDLAEAQKEIATNWIAAYKKYFHTDQPLDEHERPGQ